MHISPTETEFRRGWGYLFFQLFLLSTLLPRANQLLGTPLNAAELNFVFYLLNFSAVLLIFHRFLRISFAYILANLPRHTALIFAGTLVLLLCNTWFGRLLVWIAPDFSNFNNAQIAGMFSSQPLLILIGTVILSPLAEECFFRELIFHKLYAQNRVTAFLVSANAFACIHIVGYLGQAPGWMLALAFLQYLPAGLVLGWCYASSGSLVVPVIIHALINLRGALSLFGRL